MLFATNLAAYLAITDILLAPYPAKYLIKILDLFLLQLGMLLKVVSFFMPVMVEDMCANIHMVKDLTMEAKMSLRKALKQYPYSRKNNPLLRNADHTHFSRPIVEITPGEESAAI